ncbi:MAG: PSD1 and planctomycete cytochrome C domain-containing protein [Planctomycetaceae bacterium]
MIFSMIACPAFCVERYFEKQVAPILTQHCLSCHGGGDPKGGFSVQQADAFFADGVVEAGDAASSHLVELITPENGSAQMPKDADPLTDAQIAIIRKWIDEGADWPQGYELKEAKVDDFEWWSYQALYSPSIPKSDDDWATSAIDRFVLAKLNEHGLTYSPPADRRTLIRRVTYDLIGLPPTPEDVADFVADDDPLAYDRLVDRLLASEHYGEHWARHWLDVARYADSCGYDKDKLRPNAWPYRDYVIRSLNEDKLYARFVQEQVAGDVLFPDDPDGIVGLGFIAAGPWDFIGHVEVSEQKLDGKVARNLDRDDMVSGVVNAFCSLTVQCARCHNHKFDPMTQEHYYGLQSVFAAVDRADRAFDGDPAITKRRAKLTVKQNELVAARAKIEAEIADAGGQPLADVRAAVVDLEKQLKPVYPPEHGYHSQIAATPDQEKWVEVELTSEVQATRIVLHACSDDFNGIGDGFGFPVRFRVETTDDAGVQTIVKDATAKDFPNPKTAAVAITFAERAVRRVRVTATQLAERKDDYIFALAEVEVIAGDQNVASGAAVNAADSIEAPIRWRRSNLVDGKWPRASDAGVERQLAEATVTRDQILAAVTTPDMAQHRSSIASQIATVETELKQLPAQQSVYAAATHFKPQGNFKPTDGKPRDVFVLTRGEVGMPGKPAVPGVLPLSADSKWQFATDLSESERRAKLAQWLTDRNHPLVWRSIVNRVWQYHFGQGIVATPNDFGRMGAVPTHPELLDWLAVQFRDGGQSLKSLHRMIVTSNTYRQSAADIPANSAIDGGNQYLWRANRRRLSAEELRDSILAVSGAMNWQMGGPGYYLFALEKTEHSPHFEYHKFDPADKASHRRSIYRFIARSQPNPYMTTLDCADSSQSTPRRNETLTSLQALALLNNRFNLVMAEEFASRLQREGGDVRSQVERALSLAMQRAPEEGETQDLTEYATTHGMANLCRLLFNFSEFVFVD